MGFRVLKGGMLTTVQDLGRTGYQSQGFSVSGVMDVRSFKIANLLLDNPENEAVLEFTLMGPSHRKPRIYCFFQLPGYSGSYGKPFNEYQMRDRRF